MRAAVLHGPGDLRVEEVDEPAGEVLVEVRAATACGTDRKMLRHGHRILGGYPARFGHETAGVRIDTGEHVLVGDSVACGACAPCRA
jgi:L-iditol 2-dehydrogenase